MKEVTIMKQNKDTLGREIYLRGNLPNVIVAFLIFCYSVLLAELDWKKTLITFVLIAILVAFCILVLSPITNVMICGKISKKVEEWKLKQDEYTDKDRTDLLNDIYKLPKYKRMETFIYFLVCAMILFAIYHFVVEVNILKNVLNFIGCAFGAYIAALLSFNASSKAVKGYANKIVSQGVDDEQVTEKKYFGASYLVQFIFYVAMPIIITSLIFICYYAIAIYIDSRGNWSAIHLTRAKFLKSISIAGINIVACFLSILFFFKDIMKSSTHIQDSMTHILKNDIFTVQLNPTDISNEVSYNLYLINKIIILFRSVFKKIQNIGKEMIQPSLELSQISEETAATAYEQAAGVREILSTMEDTDDQTRGIVNKISSVTNTAEDTFKNVETGFYTLQTELDKMNEITEANQATITGIKDLGTRIGNIWEIVNIINDISEQTRIIAFNAELEASEAGDAGKSFHIVANEVRRLAAGITDSVEQIRDRITEIQHTSDNLIITSEGGTEKITEGRELTLKLETKFSDIRKSSEITVESALDIKNVVDQQSASFDQIVETLRQISSGIENFSESTNTVNETAAELKTAADNLDKLHEQIINHDEEEEEQFNIKG